MEFTQAHKELDEQLPAELRDSVELAVANRFSEAETSEDVSDPRTEDSNMSGATTTPQAVANAEVKTAVAAEVQRLFAEQNNQAAVASCIEKHMTKATAAEAVLAATQSKLASTEAELAEAKKKLPTGESTNVKDADKDAKDNKGTPPKGEASVSDPIAAKVAELEQALAAEKKKNAGFMADSKKKGREDKIDKAKIKSDKFKKRATASKEDGTLLMSDEEFEAAVAEFIEVIPAETTEQAVAGDGGGTPVAAPKSGAGPAEKQKHPSLTGKGKEGGTPIPAPQVGAGPAEKQKHPKMAHASEGGTEQTGEGEAPAAGEAAAATETTATEQAAASTAPAVPAAPDLTTAEIMASAQAALLSNGGPAASKSGKSQYAKAFGI